MYNIQIVNWCASSGGILTATAFRPHHVDLTDTAGAWTTFADHEYLRQGALAFESGLTGRLSVYFAQQSTGVAGSGVPWIHFRVYDLDNAAVVIGPIDTVATSVPTPYWFLLRTISATPTLPSGNARLELQYAIDTVAFEVGSCHLAGMMVDIYQP